MSENKNKTISRTIWLLGEKGWIANKIKEVHPEYEFIPHRNITKKEDMVNAISVTGPNDIIINCIGYTGSPNVDACESNKYVTLLANTMIPFWLAESAKNRKIVHLSTGCIYDGNGNFTEEDRPNYTGSFYSQTKMIAEGAFDLKKDLIVRLRLPITADKDPRNTLMKLLKYDRLINEKNSVTFVPDLIGAIDALIKADAVGIYNVVNTPDVCHKQIMDILGVKKEYISMKELRQLTVADRSNCTLSSKKIRKIYKPLDTISMLEKCREGIL